MKEKIMILFLCKFNRFRSQVAEVVFNKLNKNPKYKAVSAGFIRGSPLDKNQTESSMEMGYPISSKPKGVTSKMLKETKYHIIVADDVPRGILNESTKYGKKLIVWKIHDAKSDDKKEVRRIIKEIEAEVKGLVRELR